MRSGWLWMSSLLGFGLVGGWESAGLDLVGLDSDGRESAEGRLRPGSSGIRLQAEERDLPRDLVAWAKAPGSKKEPGAVLAAGLPVDIVAEKGSWIQLRCHLWVAKAEIEGEAQGSRLAAVAELLGRQKGLEDRLLLPDLRLLEARQIQAKIHGSQAELRYAVSARNEGDWRLTEPWVEMRLLDRRGKVLASARAKLKSSSELEVGQEGSWEIRFRLTRNQLKAYHRKRFRLDFFLPGLENASK